MSSGTRDQLWSWVTFPWPFSGTARRCKSSGLLVNSLNHLFWIFTSEYTSDTGSEFWLQSLSSEYRLFSPFEKQSSEGYDQIEIFSVCHSGNISVENFCNSKWLYHSVAIRRRKWWRKLQFGSALDLNLMMGKMMDSGNWIIVEEEMVGRMTDRGLTEEST